jgi:cytochrome c oxidase subunit 2
MDAVPGITTTLWFTPTITTEAMKNITHNPDFVYEISCDQLCGKGHYSMRGIIIVETQQEYDKWMASQPSYYAGNNPSATPAAGQPAADSTKTEPKTEAKAVTMK